METLSPDNPVARQRMREHLRVKQIAKQRKFRHEGLVEFYRVLLLQTPSRLIQDNTEHLLYATTFLYESSSFIKRDFHMLSEFCFRRGYCDAARWSRVPYQQMLPRMPRHMREMDLKWFETFWFHGLDIILTSVLIFRRKSHFLLGAFALSF